MKFRIFSLSNLYILLVVTGAWLVTALGTEPLLHYHSQQPAFLTTADFFLGFTTYPGGIADYLAEFISQFFYFNWFGSLLIVAIASLQGFIALDTVTRLSGKTRPGFVVFAIVLLFGILVLCDYRYPYYASIRLLFAYLFTWGYYYLYRIKPKTSIYLWPVTAILLFYLAGGPAVILFALTTFIILNLSGKPMSRMIVAVLFLVFAGALPFIGYRWIFGESLQNLYKIVLVRHPELLAYNTFYQLYIYYLLLPLLLLIFYFTRKRDTIKPAEKLSKGGQKSGIRFFNRTPFVLTVQLAGIVLLGYFLYSKSFDPFKKKVLYIEYYAENGQWNKVLKAAENVDRYDFRVNFQINRAYAHFGQLPDRLFNYPQLLGVYALFYDNTNINGSLIMPNSDLYYDLGLMSESQRWAFEAQTLSPFSPRILKRLVMINLINRRYTNAGMFLNVLDKNMLYHNWVDQYRSYVSDTTLASKDKEIAIKRRYNPQKDFVHQEPLGDLALLLETNRDNRFAFDYLLTYCILSSDFPDFLKYLSWYTRGNMKRLPRSWEEALSVYVLKAKAFPGFINPDDISEECLKRFVRFNDVLKQYNNDIGAAKNALQREFEDTYWYYILYLDPKVTNVLSQKSLIR